MQLLTKINPVARRTYTDIIPQDFYDMDLRAFQSLAKKSTRVLNLNTFPGSIPPSWLQPDGVTKLIEAFAPLRAFSSAFDPAPYTKNAKNIIKYVEAGSATIVDGTNFIVGGSAIGAVECSVSHYSQPWPVSSQDLNKGLREKDLFIANAQELANTITKAWATVLTGANFPETPIVTAVFGAGEAAAAYGRIKGPGSEKSLILNSDFFAQFSHTSPKAFQSGEAVSGWKGVHDCSAGWTSAGAKVRGVALARPAVILVAGFLEEIRMGNIQRTMITIEGLDLAVDFYRWMDQATRTVWCSLDCIAGFAKADDDAAILIQTP